MRVSIASDHAGFELKQFLIAHLEEQGYSVLDLGPNNNDSVDYPDYAAKVAESLTEGNSEWGVLICGTGIGMCMKANRYPGIRAANPVSENFAALSREHNDANVVCLSARFIDRGTNQSILDTFLNTEFGKGRHSWRVEKIG